MSACDDVTAALAEGRALTAADRAHADGCDGCARALRADASLARAVSGRDGDDLALPPLLREALADAAPVAPFSVWRSALAPVAAAGALAGAGLLAVPRPDLAHQPAGRFAFASALVAALAVAGVVAVLHRGARGLGVEAPKRLAYVLGAVAAFEAAMAATTVAVEGSVVPSGAAALRAMATCALSGTLAAALVGAALFAAARRTAPTSPGVAGAAAGAAAGFAGALFQQLACPVATLSHTMIAHAAPAVVGAAVGALVGRRVLAP